MISWKLKDSAMKRFKNIYRKHRQSLLSTMTLEQKAKPGCEHLRMKMVSNNLFHLKLKVTNNM